MMRTDLIDRSPVNIDGVAKANGVSAKMIRYYKSINLLSPSPRTEDNCHMHDAQVLHALCFVHRSRSLGFALEEVRTLLPLWNGREWASIDAKVVTLHRVVNPDAHIGELQTMCDTLMTLIDACHSDDRLDCPILQSVTGEGGEGSPESDLDTCYH